MIQGANTYGYDANGNITQRVVGGQTFNLGYVAENRLVSVSGAATADLHVEIIVMDEHDGRARARAMGLKPVGVIGILLHAKHQGRIQSVGNALQALRDEVGFYVADELFHRILKQAGEF